VKRNIIVTNIKEVLGCESHNLTDSKQGLP